jgi:hypothetical protein
MSSDLVRYELRHPAAILTLNRPDRRNALSRGLITALHDAVERAAAGQALSVEEAARASAAPRLTEECRQGLQAFFNKKPVPRAPG